jgi:asparagine synthase (glutamine-hydrolysing)
MAAPALTSFNLFRARLAAEMPGARRLIRAIREKKLTYVGRRKMKRLVFAVDLIRQQGVPGSIIEAGVALGGTAILLARMRPPGRPLLLYDVFSTIPPPGPQDEADAHQRYDIIKSGKAAGIGGEQYYGYRGDLIEQVTQNLNSFGIETAKAAIEFVPGAFENSLHPAGPVAFAHIDCDWYDSVVTCLDRIYPKLSKGGIMIFDDYKSYAGCKKAVDQFLSGSPDVEVLFSERSIGIRKLAIR